MSKIKSWLMDQELEFAYIAEETAKSCESFGEYWSRMQSHTHMIKHLERDDISQMIDQCWQAAWEKYNV